MAGAKRQRSRNELIVVLSVIAIAAVAVVLIGRNSFSGSIEAPTGGGSAQIDVSKINLQTLHYERKANPARTVALTSDGLTLASMTDGARTVVVYGKQRSLSEPQFGGPSVDTNAYVYLLPRKWSSGAQSQAWFKQWLQSTTDNQPADIFEIASQYFDKAPKKYDSKGVRVGGDASFGPANPNDPIGRDQLNDFYDYLGISWDFGGGDVKHPVKRRYGDVDCSGFVRLVYGYRAGYPLADDNAGPPDGLPRHVKQISTRGPGVNVVPNRGVRPHSFTKLQPGDLLIFDNDPTSPGLDHIAIFMGRDSAGHYRFMSSRSKVNGPTMSDVGGPSYLDSQGLYPSSWRMAIRL